MSIKQKVLSSGFTVLAILALGVALPASAIGLQGNGSIDLRVGKEKTSLNFSGKTDAEIQTQASAAIDRRIEDLKALQTRISAMARLSSTTKASLSASLTNEITELTALKVKITSETGDILRTDAKSVTGSYRVYMVVMPQIRIMAAADRAQTVADSFTALSVKFQTRITAAQTAGMNVTELNTWLADMNAKVADAKIQAQAAFNLVATLTPDDKDKAKMEANQQAFASARAKLKLAQDDLKTAHNDAKLIVKALKGEKKDAKEKNNNNNN